MFNVYISLGEVHTWCDAPWLNLVNLEVPEHAPVVVVPSHLDQLAGLVFEDGRIMGIRGEQGVRLPGSMCRDRNGRKEVIRAGVKLLQYRCDVEAIDE